MDITAISVIIAAISVVVGVFFTVKQMHQATTTQNTRLIIQLNPALQASVNELITANAEIRKLEFTTYNEYREKYGDPVSNNAFITLAAYYDGLGFLLNKHFVDSDIIEYLLSGAVTTLWEKLQPIVMGMRNDQQNPELFEWFESLYNLMTNSN